MCEKTSSLGVYRETVFDRMDEERAYQDKLNTDTMTVGEELVLMREYLNRAQATYSTSFGDPHEEPTMHVIRKIAALAIRCMEHHGAPERTTDG